MCRISNVVDGIETILANLVFHIKHTQDFVLLQLYQ